MIDKYSIIIVSWANLEYLKCTIQSITKNSRFKHEIIVHVNEAGADGTIDWLEDNKIKYTQSAQNVGLCIGANTAAQHATHDYLCLADDDLYLLPDWDYELSKFHLHNKLGELFWISSTMIEPRLGPNTTISPYPFGKGPNDLQEQRLLNSFKSLQLGRKDMVNIQATPLLVSKASWNQVGGYNDLFTPGIGSEDALAKALWDIGCRNFVSVASSCVYHFQTQTTSRLQQYTRHSENREKQFLKLHNMKCKDFKVNLLNWRTPWVKKNS